MNKVFLLVITTVALISFRSNAQNIWMGDVENSVSLEMLKPIFKENEFHTFTSSTSIFSTNISLSDQLNLYGEIPFVHGKFKDDDLNNFIPDSELSVGNIYLGIQTKNPNTPIHFEIGIRLPTSKINFKNNNIALFADIDRSDAFLINYTVIPIKAVYIKDLMNEDFLKIRAGIDAFFGKNDFDNEQFFDYSVQYEKRNKDTNILLGFIGSIILSEDRIDFSDRMINSFGGAVKLTKGSLHPGIMFKFPLDEDLNDILNYSVGINLTKQF